MMRYRFDTLLRLRKDQESLVQKDFGKIQMHLIGQQDHLATMEQADKKSQEEFQRRQKREMDIRTRILFDRFHQGVQQESVVQKKIITEISEKLEDKRVELTEAMRKRRTLEILKERDLLAFQQKQMKQEIEVLDEVAANRQKPIV